jgi:phosphopantothenoylcysteine decarboxylase / phosphopantothenate---cysteine ligase
VLKGKKILIGITGSIAAYKTVLLVRELAKSGAEVQVICTKSALDFITPLTLSTLSQNPVYSDFLIDSKSGEWTNHVRLGKWADLFVIAPLSANTLSKLVHGLCDNLLLATFLSADCPIMVAPAMDLDMYHHWTTQQNLSNLRKNGVKVIDVGDGELASGLVGKGRMAEPEDIYKAIGEYFDVQSKLSGRKILITAGPTYEKIDPVRFIGNYSSGKMGYSIAQEAFERGCSVTLISGPTALPRPGEGIDFISVESAEEMLSAVDSHYHVADVVIMSAAVADYRPKHVFQDKQKKESKGLNAIELEETTDILKSLGKQKNHQFLVGFALETNDELANGRRKLENKNLDMLVMNSLNDKGAGFGTDTNKVTFIFPEGNIEHSLKDKRAVAKDIFDAIENRI